MALTARTTRLRRRTWRRRLRVGEGDRVRPGRALLHVEHERVGQEQLDLGGVLLDAVTV